MKYLIMEDFSGHPVLFTFPNRVNHADMREQLPYNRVISAGYFSLQNGKFICSGGCAELQASADAEKDSVFISKCFTAGEDFRA
ncbi:MAG: hypothetical protein PUB69_01145 [Desulfovibrionaceae bacterium]|nr:hypothetical protein [Desulfovibrionaceae bacterium]